MTYLAIIRREGAIYAALCPELDIASQGATVAEARANLAEAVALFLETADPTEIAARGAGEVFITQITVVG